MAPKPKKRTYDDREMMEAYITSFEEVFKTEMDVEDYEDKPPWGKAFIGYKCTKDALKKWLCEYWPFISMITGDDTVTFIETPDIDILRCYCYARVAADRVRSTLKHSNKKKE